MKTKTILAILVVGLSNNLALAMDHVSAYINGQLQDLQFNHSALPSSIVLLPTMNNHEQMARAFISANAGMLGVTPKSELKLNQFLQGEYFSTERFQHFYQGLEVIGGDSVVHIANNQVIGASADNLGLEHLDLKPSLSANDAESIALANYSGQAWKTEPAQLKIIVVPNNASKEARLTYRVTVRDKNNFGSDIYYIDAHSGDIVFSTTNVHTLMHRQVYAGQGDDADFDNLDKVAATPDNDGVVASTFTLVKEEDGNCGISAAPPTKKKTKPKTLLSRINTPSLILRNSATGNESQDCRAASNPTLANSVTNVWDHMGIVYEFYKQTYNRDSFNNAGAEMRSVVNLGQDFENAAWIEDIHLMIYGNGDPQHGTLSFAKPLDVTAHELTHGVTAQTARLAYSGQSGALNESYSDVFAKLVVYKQGGDFDWILGKDLFANGQGYIRDMQNPKVGNMKDIQFAGVACVRENDFCGVHVNSGIPSKAAYLIATKLGMDKLSAMYYPTLTQLLRTNSDFNDAKQQTIFACQKIYGQDSADCTVVQQAFEAVGI